MSLSGLESWARPSAQWCLDVARWYGITVRVTSVRRSSARQAELRRRWEQGLSRWPANRAGESAHEYGMAWDSVVDPRYQAWWDEVRRMAGWRIPARDEIHAEVPGWRRIVGRTT